MDSRAYGNTFLPVERVQGEAPGIGIECLSPRARRVWLEFAGTELHANSGLPEFFYASGEDPVGRQSLVDEWQTTILAPRPVSSASWLRAYVSDMPAAHLLIVLYVAGATMTPSALGSDSSPALRYPLRTW